jgi:hypothetical protein
MSDGICEHRERAVVVGVDLAVGWICMSVDGDARETGRSLLGDVAMDEDVAWGRGSDDAFGDTGVRTPQPENLHNGYSHDEANFGRKRTLGLWPLAEFSKKPGSAASTAFDHCSLELKSFARVSSICVELW